VQKLREIGIQADVLVCRCEKPLERSVLEKMAMFCNVAKDAVFTSVDVDTVYRLPTAFAQQGFDTALAKMLNIWSRGSRLDAWEDVVRRITSPRRRVRIGFVGKYVQLIESYKSLNEALIHGGIANDSKVEIQHIDSESITAEKGKIVAVRHARENKIPFFGICLGLQMAVIEFARHVCGLADANSTELVESTPHPVVDFMPDQRGITEKGGTMRLGAYPCVLKPGTRAAEAYEATEISERHRHRYEVNNNYRDALERNGMVLSGLSPDGRLVEMIELPQHPYFVACQFHPEFKSRPWAPHPLFARFVKAVCEYVEKPAQAAAR
jgi:CTP synthase